MGVNDFTTAIVTTSEWFKVGPLNLF